MNKNNKTFAIIVGIFLTNALPASNLEQKYTSPDTLNSRKSYLYPTSTPESTREIADQIAKCQKSLANMLKDEEKNLRTVFYVPKKHCVDCTLIVNERTQTYTIISCANHNEI